MRTSILILTSPVSCLDLILFIFLLLPSSLGPTAPRMHETHHRNLNIQYAPHSYDPNPYRLGLYHGATASWVGAVPDQRIVQVSHLTNVSRSNCLWLKMIAYCSAPIQYMYPNLFASRQSKIFRLYPNLNWLGARDLGSNQRSALIDL